MKNIHVLPTDKPSRLIFNSFYKSFCYQKEIDGMYINDGKVSGADFWGLQKALNNGFKPQNIYITSDEEIKEGDWFLEKSGRQYPIQWNGIEKLNFHCKKIILTTDQELIKDGVQEITDEFLEWFVKNPSCESVEIEKSYSMSQVSYSGIEYDIIIPKEEPKQETLEESVDRASLLEFPIKEWYRSDDYNREEITAARDGFKKGAKWRAERMYSFSELRLWLIERDVYLYNYYTTYKKSGIPMESVDKFIEDSHEYLMDRKQLKNK